ncbi:unnamed protein product, partial [Iphiclides podalirius]
MPPIASANNGGRIRALISQPRRDTRAAAAELRNSAGIEREDPRDPISIRPPLHHYYTMEEPPDRSHREPCHPRGESPATATAMVTADPRIPIVLWHASTYISAVGHMNACVLVCLRRRHFVAGLMAYSWAGRNGPTSLPMQTTLGQQ